MLTPLLMLVLLVTPWALSRVVPAWRSRGPAAAAAGAGLLFLFTSSGHFLQAGPMAEMLPPWVPYRAELVLLTGFLEIAVGLGFFWHRTRQLSAWLAAAMLVLFFPANVYAAFNQVPMGGHAWGPVYLLVRAPVQLAILAWLWIFWLRQGVPSRRLHGFGPRAFR